KGLSLQAVNNSAKKSRTEMDFVVSLDIPKEVRLIKNYLKEYCRKHHQNVPAEISKDLPEKLNVTVKTIKTETSSYLSGIITCHICKKTQTVQRKVNENWNTSNMIIHIKQHISRGDYNQRSLDSWTQAKMNTALRRETSSEGERNNSEGEDNCDSVDLTEESPEKEKNSSEVVDLPGTSTREENTLTSELSQDSQDSSDEDFQKRGVAEINPSPSSPHEVQRTLASCSKPVKEGDFRFDELSEFLTQHKLPRKVYISEDGTRIVQKFLYDLTSDQIIGPVPKLDANGVPIISGFPASSAAMITHFEKCAPSSSAYAIMAQPLSDGASSFCLCIFGTDNKFTSEHVYRRWHYIFSELEKRDIEVIGYSSDGDQKLLTAMHSFLFKSGPVYAEEFQSFYFASSDQKFIVMQDYIHTVNKFRARLHPSNYLPLGDFSANQSHLTILMNLRPRDEHCLNPSDLLKDKMNFNSSLRICSERVTDLLEKYEPGSKGTIAYLKVMRRVMQAGMDQNNSPLKKIFDIWHLRSLTTTESTVINFAMKQCLEKVRRVEMLHNVSSKLSTTFVFPREKRKSLAAVLTTEKLLTTYLPTNSEIKTAVMSAKNDAMEDLEKLGITCARNLDNIKSTILACPEFQVEENSEGPSNNEANVVDEDDIPLNLLAIFPSPDSISDLEPYANIEGFPVVSNKSHVTVPDKNGGFKLVAKSLLCYMFSSVGVVNMNNI
ncbi:HTH-type transcriptional regulator PrsX, partial [Frankliniella fusca]